MWNDHLYDVMYVQKQSNVIVNRMWNYHLYDVMYVQKQCLSEFHVRHKHPTAITDNVLPNRNKYNTGINTILVT